MATLQEISKARGYTPRTLTARPSGGLAAISESRGYRVGLPQPVSLSPLASISQSRGYGSTAILDSPIPSRQEFYQIMGGEANVKPWQKTALTNIERRGVKLETVDRYEPPEEDKENWLWRTMRKFGVDEFFIAGALIEAGKHTNMKDALSPTAWGKVVEAGVKSARAGWTGKNLQDVKTYTSWLETKQGGLLEKAHIAGMKLTGNPLAQWVEKYGYVQREGKIDPVDVIGLSLGVVGSPLTYLGVGGLSKVGRLRQLGPIVKRMESLQKAGKLSDDAVKWIKAGHLAPTRAEQAAVGQRALVSMAGQPVIRGAPVFKALEFVGEATGKVVSIKRAAQMFSKTALTSIPHGELQAMKELQFAHIGKRNFNQTETLETIGDFFKQYNSAENDAVFHARQWANKGGLDEFETALMEAAEGVGKERALKALSAWKKNPEGVQQGARRAAMIFDDMADDLDTAGILDTFLSDYIPHRYPKYAGQGPLARWLSRKGIIESPADVALSGGVFSGEKLRRVGMPTGRKFETAVDSINAGFSPETSAPHVTLLYMNEAYNALFHKGLVDDVLSSWGERVTWAKGRGMLRIAPGTGLYMPRSVVKSMPSQVIKGITKFDDHLIEVTPRMADELAKLGEVATTEAYRMPVGIANYLNNFFDVGSSDASYKAITGLFKRYNAIWKPWVTIVNPGFHFRNYFGGLWNNYLQGIMTPGPYLKAFSEQRKALRAKLAGKPISGMAREALENGVMRQGFYMGETAASVDRQLIDAMAKGPRKALQYLRPTKGYGRALTGLVEDNLRLANYIYHRGQGMSPKAAAYKTIESQFTYVPEAYTAFDNMLRTFAFPFWAWTRSNIPYQLRKMVERPGQYAVPGKVLSWLEKNSSETPLERKYRRDYFNELMATPVPDQFADFARGVMVKVAKLNPFTQLAKRSPRLKPYIEKWEREGFTHKGRLYLNPNFPFQDVAKFSENNIKELTSMMHPLIKTVLQAGMMQIGGRGVDFFTKREIKPGDMDIAPSWMQAVYQIWGDRPVVAKGFAALGVEEGMDGIIRIPPMSLLYLETAIPPAAQLHRGIPRDPEIAERYAEEGRLYDQWLTSSMSWMMGVKFLLPSVAGEAVGRVIEESQRLKADMRKAGKLGHGNVRDPETGALRFAPFRRGETPQQYEQRIGGM